MPVDALKTTIGAPLGRGSLRATSRATDATLRLLSLRTSPRLMRWVKKSFILLLPIVPLLIPQLDEQISSYIFEEFFMLFSEMFFPAARLSRAEGMTLFRLNGFH